MRNTVIGIFESLVWVIGALYAITGLIVGVIMLAEGGAIGILVVIGGFLGAVAVMALFFIQIATYHNTRRTAEAVERLANR